MAIQLQLDRHVQGDPNPDPAGESIGRQNFISLLVLVVFSLKFSLMCHFENYMEYFWVRYIPDYRLYSKR